MAKFFVGQRVRIVRAEFAFHLIGTESVVLGVNESFLSKHDGIFRHGYVRLDMRDGDGARFFALPENLEPILPSGHTAGTESFQELMDRLNTQRVEKVEEVGA